MKIQNKKTLNQLKEKADSSFRDKVRMPSLVSIHNLLDELKIKNSIGDWTNVVEYRSGRNTYVNDRHEGKTGKRLIVGDLELDSTSSYYSLNTKMYARKLLEIINKYEKQ